MSSSPDNRENYFNDDLSDEEVKSFESELKEDPEKLKDFVRESFMRSQLRRHFRSQVNLKQFHEVTPKTPRILKFSLAALLLLSLGLSVVLIQMRTEEYRTKPVLAECLSLEGKVFFEGKALNSGDSISSGSLELQDGEMTLMFKHGSEVLIKAPAQLEIKNENLVVLKDGDLAAKITEKGKGFTVLGPDAAIIDIGTEFAVSVKNDQSWVEVVDGEVDIALLDKDGQAWKNQNLKTSGTYEIDGEGGRLIKKDNKALIKFDHSELNGLEVGDVYVRMVMEDKPLHYLRFNKNFYYDKMQKKDLNFITTKGDVLIKKDALNFPNGKRYNGLFSMNDINSDFFDKDFTLEFWVNPAFSQQRVVCEVLLSEFDENLKSRLLKLSILPIIPRSIYPGGAFQLSYGLWHTGETGILNTFTSVPYEVNVWQHIAITKEGEHLNLYLNGKASKSIKVSSWKGLNQNCDIVFGAQPAINRNKNHFKGLIDEISLYNKSLSAERINAHYSSLLQIN